MTREDPLPAALAAADRRELLGYAGSRHWAQLMADARPHADLDAVLAAADAAFDALDDADWLEAFAAHSPLGAPRAGDRTGAGEQSGLTGASEVQRVALAEGNRRYAARFGHVFLIRAAGRSAAEILAELERRLDHDAATELALAAAQQREITRRRLTERFGR